MNNTQVAALEHLALEIALDNDLPEEAGTELYNILEGHVNLFLEGKR
jgi:hypothetical protein